MKKKKISGENIEETGTIISLKKTNKENLS